MARARREGSIYQRKSDGRWCASVTLPDGARKVFYAQTQRAALAKLQAFTRAPRSPSAGKAETVSQFLERWISTSLPGRVAIGRLASSTAASYEAQIRRHILPALGTVQLTELSPAQVRAWLAVKVAETSHRGTPLSPRTVAYLHAVLRAALADAVREERLERNVAQLVTPPRAAAPAVHPLDREELAAVLRAVEDDRLRALWVTLLSLGLRRGEALALRWLDLDIAEGRVTISRSLQRLRAPGEKSGRLVESATKTGRSDTLAIPPILAEALETHRRLQARERMAARVWVDPGLVFTTTVGTPLEPRNVNRAWAAVCAKARIRPVRVHDLRHTAATLLLAQGVDMKTVQATLRHSRMATTADIYSHVTEELQRTAANRMEDALRSLPHVPPECAAT
jgi:integrase